MQTRRDDEGRIVAACCNEGDDIVWHEEFFTGKVTWCLPLHGYDGAEWTEVRHCPFCGAKLTAPEPTPAPPRPTP